MSSFCSWKDAFWGVFTAKKERNNRRKADYGLFEAEDSSSYRRRGVDGVQIGEIAVVLESAQISRKDRTYLRLVSAIASGLLADKRSPGGYRLGTCQTSE